MLPPAGGEIFVGRVATTGVRAGPREAAMHVLRWGRRARARRVALVAVPVAAPVAVAWVAGVRHVRARPVVVLVVVRVEDRVPGRAVADRLATGVTLVRRDGGAGTSPLCRSRPMKPLRRPLRTQRSPRLHHRSPRRASEKAGAGREGPG